MTPGHLCSGLPQRRAHRGWRGAPQPWWLQPQSPAGGTSELQCWGLPPPKPVRSILPASPGSGGHSWRSWARSRVPPASASVISWPSPWSLRPQFPLLVGTPLMGSGPPPVTSIAGRDPISKQGHVHTCPMGGAVLPRWSQTHPGECGTSTGRWLGLQEELRPWKDHGGPSGQQRARPREAGGRPAQPRVPGLTMQALVSSRLTAAACPGAPAPLWGDNPAGQAPQGCGQAAHSPSRLQRGLRARSLPNDLCFLTEATEASPTQTPSREDL